MDFVIAGEVAPQFERVQVEFARLFEAGAETGAALAVADRGHTVVDLRGGWRDAEHQHPWAPDTLVNTYSVGKPIAALCALLLVDRGQLDLDAEVRRYWPHFADGGVLVRHVLAHTAGLPAFPIQRPAAALADWDQLTADLASSSPLWPPGTVAAEHVVTYGHLVGELVRRVDGRSLGRFLSEEIALPWRLDLGFGLDADAQRRCADLEYGEPGWPQSVRGEPGSLRAQAFASPAGCLDLKVINSPLWRGAEIPAVNLHATAVALARLYQGLLAAGSLDGVQLWSPASLAEALRVQYDGPDVLLGRTVRWTLGMQLDDDGSWGMGGVGGSIGYADPARGYAFAYVTRRLANFDRVDALADTVNQIFDESRR